MMVNNLDGKILTGLVLLTGTLGYINHRYFPKETRVGEYQGYRVEAFREGSMRTVILFPECRPERIIGTDYLPDREGFDLVETMFLPENDPLRKLATPENLEDAWNSLWEKDQ